MNISGIFSVSWVYLIEIQIKIQMYQFQSLTWIRYTFTENLSREDEEITS